MKLQLLKRNSAVFEVVIPQIIDHAPDRAIVVTTNPVGIITHYTSPAPAVGMRGAITSLGL